MYIVVVDILSNNVFVPREKFAFFLANLIYLRLLIISEYHKRPNKNVFLTHVRIRADELFQVSSRSG